jgi:hypothetical protein
MSKVKHSNWKSPKMKIVEKLREIILTKREIKNN